MAKNEQVVTPPSVGGHDMTLMVDHQVRMQTQDQRTEKKMLDWTMKIAGMIFLRNLWQGLSRTFVSDCKHACSRLADTFNI